MSNFHSLEVVGRGSETQLKVGVKFHYSVKRFKGLGLCANGVMVLVFADFHLFHLNYYMFSNRMLYYKLI